MSNEHDFEWEFVHFQLTYIAVVRKRMNTQAGKANGLSTTVL